MIDFIQRWLPRSLRRPKPIPQTLWQAMLAAHPFLAALDTAAQQRLRLLCTHFLLEKEFFGANGLVLTDAMALAIAAQACLPLLDMHGVSGEPVHDPLQLLDWYGDFVGIVVQPGAVVARRKTTDGAGVVHQYDEVLAGEAMDRGPLMLSWEDESYDRFCEAVSMAERFGGEVPWLDDYAAKDAAEFFAVTCEAYFVNRARFETEFPELMPLYDGFFHPARKRR